MPAELIVPATEAAVRLSDVRSPRFGDRGHQSFAWYEAARQRQKFRQFFREANEAKGPGARVAVELTPESARRLVKAILAALEEAEVDGWLSEPGDHAHGHEPAAHAEVALQSS
jgi:hypothetical protein